MSDANAQLLAGDIEEALNAAQRGHASQSDWDLIYFACGLRQQHQVGSFFNFLSVGDKHDFDRQGRQ